MIPSSFPVFRSLTWAITKILLHEELTERTTPDSSAARVLIIRMLVLAHAEYMRRVCACVARLLRL